MVNFLLHSRMLKKMTDGQFMMEVMQNAKIQ